MATFYLDTSALVKRYIDDVGTDWARATLDPVTGHALVTSTLTRVELVAALMRRGRASGAVMFDVQRRLALFRGHWHVEYRPLEVTEAVLDRAVDIAERHGLRGYDAVHVAGALVRTESIPARGRSPLIFASADDEQLAAAAAEGLITLNPATMP